MNSILDKCVDLWQSKLTVRLFVYAFLAADLLWLIASGNIGWVTIVAALVSGAHYLWERFVRK